MSHDPDGNVFAPFHVEREMIDGFNEKQTRAFLQGAFMVALVAAGRITPTYTPAEIAAMADELAETLVRTWRHDGVEFT